MKYVFDYDSIKQWIKAKGDSLGNAFTKITDGAEFALVTTSSNLQVSISEDTVGVATSAKQLPDGHSVVLSAGAVTVGKVYVTDGVDDVDVVEATDDSTNLHSSNGIVANSIANFRISSTKIKPARMDASTHSIQTLSYEHHEIHAGSSYFHKEAYGVAKNATIDHLIVTPASSAFAHMVISVENTTSLVDVYLYKDTITTDDGAVDDIHNRNQNYPDANTTEIYTTPTTSAVGTMLWSVALGAGKNLPGGSVRDSEELVLEQNNKYLLRITEPNVAPTTVNIAFDFYEHTDKD